MKSAMRGGGPEVTGPVRPRQARPVSARCCRAGGEGHEVPQAVGLLYEVDGHSVARWVRRFRERGRSVSAMEAGGSESERPDLMGVFGNASPAPNCAKAYFLLHIRT